MMLVILLLIAFDAAIVAQTYAPEVLKFKNAKKKDKSKALNINDVVGRKTRWYSKISFRRDTIYKVLTNVEEPPKLTHGRNNMQRGLRREIKFTDKDDVRPKDDSEYKLRLSLDTLGTITNIEFVSGKKDDLFYSQLLTEIVKYPWKPAVDYGKAVNYVMPVMVVLKPRNNKKTYKIVVPKLLKVKTVF
ncbi:MAG: hypothetical protein M0D57_17815 [Sphingobacteriales bacterium JAD_PAG50586_3]|nr:MAG: hypothetical protein M0D57_17815 [Sphingobacteriales bacterium JAD_PAG50586_3]